MIPTTEQWRSYLPNGPDGHYPLAIGDLIAKSARLVREGKVSKDMHQILLRRLLLPLWQYRPLPEARRFHQSRAKFRWCFGGNRCVAPWTMIDRPDGEPRRIDSIKGEHVVWSWDGEKRVPAIASEPFIKGYEQMYRLALSNGQEITVTENHRVLGGDGAWKTIQDIFSLQNKESYCSPQISHKSLLGMPHFASFSEFHVDFLPRKPRLYEQVLNPLRDYVSEFLKRQNVRQSLELSYLSCNAFSKIHQVYGYRFLQVPSTYNPYDDLFLILHRFAGYILCCIHNVCQAISEIFFQPSPICKTASYHDLSFHEFSFSSPDNTSVNIIGVQDAGVQPVWDMEVHHESHAYTAHGLIHHNSSKSEGLAHEVAWTLKGEHPYQPVPRCARVWYATLTWEMVGSVLWNKLERILHGHKYEVVWHNRARKIPNLIRLKTRYGISECSFKAYEQKREAFQGTEKHLVAFDEQSPQDIYEESISRVGAGFVLRFAQAATPLKPQPWLEERVNGGELPPRWDTFSFPLDDNRISAGGFIEDEEIDALIDEWPEETVETRRNGAWGSFLGVVYTTFLRSTHVVPPEQEAQEIFLGRGLKVSPLWVKLGSIDWGAQNPFVFLLAIQVPHLDNEFYVLDEYYYTPRTRGMRLIENHAKEIKDLCEKWGFKESAMRRIWSDHDAQDRFEIEKHGIITRPAKKDVLAGIESVQTCLKVRGGRPRIRIAQRCKHLIRELVSYKWAEGTELRDAKDEPVKKDDHACYAKGTLIHTNRGLVPVEDMVAGDVVESHLGKATVVASAMTGYKQCIEVYAGCSKILVTHDHKFFTESGICQAKDLKIGQKLYCLPEQLSQLNTKPSLVSKHSKSNTEVMNGEYISMEGIVTKGIFEDAVEKAQRERLNTTSFIKWFILSILVIYQMTCTFITRTGIAGTTIPTIWKQFQQKITQGFIGIQILLRKQNHGINQMRVASGTLGMESEYLQRENQLVINAKIAKKSLKQKQVIGKQDFAAMRAKHNQDSEVALITRLGRANTVEEAISATNILEKEPVREDAQHASVGRIESRGFHEVYNISTTDGSVVANGIVTRQCDALRYLIYSETKSIVSAPVISLRKK